MKISATLLSAAAIAASVAVSAAPAHAAVILFSDFDTGVSNANNMDWVRSGKSGHLFTTSTASANSLGAAAVKFTFLDDPALPDFDSLKANFTLNANVAAMFDGSTYTQTGITGTFSFIYEGATTTLDSIHLVHNVTNLLSGSFTDAWIQGVGGVGGLDVSLGNGGSAHFTSSVYSFADAVANSDEFSFHLATVTPKFGAIDPSTGCSAPGVCTHNGTTALNSFRAHAGGDFQYNAVPEPSTWGLMIVGFGGVGALLRRRRTSLSLAAA
ncbi:MAG: PEPxxWA-CTERM sorting domain-containing protein [Phenylobacterium sp.]